jgi:hypothetical protein
MVLCIKNALSDHKKEWNRRSPFPMNSCPWPFKPRATATCGTMQWTQRLCKTYLMINFISTADTSLKYDSIVYAPHCVSAAGLYGTVGYMVLG